MAAGLGLGSACITSPGQLLILGTTPLVLMFTSSVGLSKLHLTIIHPGAQGTTVQALGAEEGQVLSQKADVLVKPQLPSFPLIFFLRLRHGACRILVPYPRIKPMYSALGAWSLQPTDHQEVPTSASFERKTWFPDLALFLYCEEAPLTTEPQLWAGLLSQLTWHSAYTAACRQLLHY